MTYLLPVHVARLEKMVKLASELARKVFPDFALVVLQPILLLRQPVGLVRASLGDEINLETSFLEDIERMESFSYEETCLFPFGI